MKEPLWVRRIDLELPAGERLGIKSPPPVQSV
jgi:hypothetical protein